MEWFDKCHVNTHTKCQKCKCHVSQHVTVSLNQLAICFLTEWAWMNYSSDMNAYKCTRVNVMKSTPERVFCQMWCIHYEAPCITHCCPAWIVTALMKTHAVQPQFPLCLVISREKQHSSSTWSSHEKRKFYPLKPWLHALHSDFPFLTVIIDIKESICSQNHDFAQCFYCINCILPDFPCGFFVYFNEKGAVILFCKKKESVSRFSYHLNWSPKKAGSKVEWFTTYAKCFPVESSGMSLLL